MLVSRCQCLLGSSVRSLSHKENINCVYLLEKHNVCFFLLLTAMTKNDFQPPNYYEVMEFDPLAPAVTTE